MTHQPTCVRGTFRRLRTAPRTVTFVVAATGTLSLALGGCGSSSSGERPTPSAVASATMQAASLTVIDPWVKAANEGMTGAFGTLTNSGDSDVHIVGATTVGARLELHEMAPGADGTLVMTQTKDGFVVPAHGTRVLEPGGEHIMFMDMTQPVEAGVDVEITLELEDGSTVMFTAPGRTFAGANENYHGTTSDDMSGVGDDPASDASSGTAHNG